MTDIRKRLEALTRNPGLMTGQQWRSRIGELQKEREEGAYEIERVVPGELVGVEEDGFYLARTVLPLDAPQGNTTLGAVLEALPEHIAFAARDEALTAFDARKAVFVDTETSGIGGAGIFAFLVGAGYFDEETFVLEQCFMRDFDDEPPMVEYLAELFQRFETVVFYNGKSFDLPLLRSRFIQNRLPFRLEGANQLDLLHAARRFWKRRLRDCSLTAVERAILGFSRQGDVPSAEIPRMWLDYLRTRDARPLQGVFYHHRMDILSLVALTHWLSRHVAEAESGPSEHGEDQLSLVRLLFVQRQYEKVAAHGARLLDSCQARKLRHECFECMGLALKRLGEFEQMQEVWEAYAAEFPEDMSPRLELAKHHEHRTRDLAEARRVCRDAIAFLNNRESLRRVLGQDPSGLAEFQRRLQRVESKMQRAGADLDD